MSETTSAEPREFDALDGPEGVNGPSGCTDTPGAESEPQEAVERITDAEAAEWARLAAEATEGPWVVDQDGSIGAPMAGFCGLWVVNANVSLIETDATFIAASRTAVPRLLAEREALRADLAEARATIARLNARAQVAEAALHELTTTTGKGKAHRVAREVWQRCEESHGLVCPTTGRARDLAARLEDELARLREGVEQLCAWIDRPLHERPVDAPVDLPELAEDLRALLANADGARPVAQCMVCGRDVFAGDALCCPIEDEGGE